MLDGYPMTEVSEGYPWTLGVSKSPVFVNPTPFDVWLYGFPCYDKYLSLNEGVYYVDGIPESQPAQRQQTS